MSVKWQHTSQPHPRRLAPDDREALIELLRDGTVYAKRTERGIVFVHIHSGGQEDAMPIQEAIDYLNRK